MSKKIKYLKNKKLQTALDTALLDNIESRTESLKIGVIYQSHFYKYSYGKDYKFYDLASLTKVIFTVCAFMHYEQNVQSLVEKKVIDILPWFKASRHIKVKDLLAHQSGAPALYPVYKELQYNTLSGLEPLNLLLRDLPFNENKSVYSDVGFFILGAVLESIYAKPLIKIFDQLKGLYAFGSIHFNPSLEKLKRPKLSYAPTEHCPLRGKKIQGEVHDENCWKMGGVGPHAGLFGTLDDVLIWLNDFNLKLKSKDFKKIKSKFLKKQQGDWRLGLMTPSKPVSSCGTYFSKQSLGHLGFTGVSFWTDPRQDLSVVILSNRTYPNRDNKSFNELRPVIHNTIWEALV